MKKNFLLSKLHRAEKMLGFELSPDTLTDLEIIEKIENIRIQYKIII